MTTKTYQRAYIVGDKETGVLVLTLNPLRAALIGRAEIDAYATRHKQTIDDVFGRVAAAIKGLIWKTDRLSAPNPGQQELKAFAEMIAQGATVTDAEFCFISDVDTSNWGTLRNGFLPIEPVITDLDAFRQGDVPLSVLKGPGDKPSGKAKTAALIKKAVVNTKKTPRSK